MKENDSVEISNSAPKSKTFLGLAMVGITTGYIFGPMILFGGIGWWLHQRYDNVFILLIAFFIALVTSNFLIFKRTGSALKKLK